MSIVNDVGNKARDCRATSAITHGGASTAAFATAVIVMPCPTIGIITDVVVVLNIVFVVVLLLLAVIVAT